MSDISPTHHATTPARLCEDQANLELLSKEEVALQQLVASESQAAGCVNMHQMIQMQTHPPSPLPLITPNYYIMPLAPPCPPTTNNPNPVAISDDARVMRHACSMLCALAAVAGTSARLVRANAVRAVGTLVGSADTVRGCAGRVFVGAVVLRGGCV